MHLSLLNIPEEDLIRCHDIVGVSTWRRLRGLRIFVTGGTGFIGKWLFASLLYADQALGLDCRITMLSRDPSAFERAWPFIASKANWVTGDVRDFPISSDQFDVIIHAATDVVEQTSPQDVFSTCIDGTRRVLELAKHCKARLLLLVSSGAVYGTLPAGMTHVSETYCGGLDPLSPSSAYGEGKRVAEWLCAQASPAGLEVKIARVFALVGPHLPLNKQFAIGNFLSDAIVGKQIAIYGDGSNYRSYLYAADMAAWLWAVLLKGRHCRAYNVGSDEIISIFALAERVCYILDRDPSIAVQQKEIIGAPKLQYAPDVSRARHELLLPVALPLNEAISRTARWHQAITDDA